MSQAPTHSDQYLIDGLLSNQSSIVQLIYRNHGPKIYNWVKQNNGSLAQAEDLLQDALLDIYRKASNEGLKLTCPFDAFLFAVCRNKWLFALKKSSQLKVTNMGDHEYNIAQTDAEEVMKFEAKYSLLFNQLEQLQTDCRELLKMNWGGINLEAIAQQLNTTYAYIRKKKSLCMAKLIALVKDSVDFKQLIN